MHSQQIAVGERWLIEGGGTDLALGAAVVLWFWETPGAWHVRDLNAAGQSCNLSVIGPFIGLFPEGLRRGYAVLVVTDRAVPGPTVCLSVGWSDGDTELVEVPFGQVDRRVPSSLGAPAPKVAICMATFEPRLDLFTNQVRSLQAQSMSDWICLVQDDGSSAQTIEHMQEVFGDDPRFVLEANAENVGFYLNFGRSLARVPAGTGYVALCDQDDAWYPDKLERLVAALDADPTATLIYSDMRVVDATGRAIRDDFPLGVASDRGVEAMVVANLVTGCSTLFRASLLDVALPLPEARNAYHDHWIATVAAARGVCAYYPRPLMDYYQHGNNTLGYRGSHAFLILKLLVAIIATPAIALAAVFSPTRRMIRRYLEIMLNQTRDEYIVRETFRVVLQSRAGVAAPQVSSRGRGRALQLAVQTLTGVRRGSGYTAISLRLCAAALLEWAIARIGPSLR